MMDPQTHFLSSRIRLVTSGSATHSFSILTSVCPSVKCERTASNLFKARSTIDSAAFKQRSSQKSTFMTLLNRIEWECFFSFKIRIPSFL